MLTDLAKHWWLLALRGVLGIIFGLIALAQPGFVGVWLVVFFGALAMVEGALALAWAFTGGHPAKPRWTMGLLGVLGIIAGIFAFTQPLKAGLAIVWFIAGYAIATGVTEILAAIQLRKQIRNEWFLILTGIVTIIFGGMLLSRPVVGAEALIILLGAFVLVYSFMMILFAFRLRKLNKHLADHEALGHHHGQSPA